MENRQHDLMRQQMIAEIVADAVFLTAQLGKSAFAPRVIEAMGKIPRHEFVPLELQSYAYINSPLPVGYGKTISQPFIVALMTDLLELQPGDVTLEVGAGVGYQAAILSELVNKVYSIELIEELRRDSPTLKNRTDQEARQMSVRTTPGEVLIAIKDSHEEMTARSTDAADAAE